MPTRTLPLLRSIYHSPLRTSYPGCAASMCFPILASALTVHLFLHMDFRCLTDVHNAPMACFLFSTHATRPLLKPSYITWLPDSQDRHTRASQTFSDIQPFLAITSNQLTSHFTLRLYQFRFIPLPDPYSPNSSTSVPQDINLFQHVLSSCRALLRLSLSIL